MDTFIIRVFRILILDFNDSIGEMHHNNGQIMIVSVKKSLSSTSLKFDNQNETDNRVNILWPKVMTIKHTVFKN